MYASGQPQVYFAELGLPNLTNLYPYSNSNSRFSHPAVAAECEICVSMCVSLRHNLYTRVFSYLLPVHWNTSQRLNQSSKEKKPQTVSCNGTFWVIFSSCFADWSWLRYSITLKLAVVNFSCSAFTSGLSAFEEKNVLGKNSILREKRM